MSEEKSLAIKTGERGLVLTSLDEMQRWAEGVMKSQLAPATLNTTAKILVATQCGLEIGLSPMQALQSIYVVKGKPTLWGDAALGLVKRSGLCKYCKESVAGSGDERRATIESCRKDTGEIVCSTFSVADAKKAHLWGKDGPWTTHPDRMLKYKARAFNLRDNFPDVLMGMHITEEMQGEEPLPAPQNDTPPRDLRRKKVASTIIKEEPIKEEIAQQKVVDENTVWIDKQIEAAVSDKDGSTEADDTAGAGEWDEETEELFPLEDGGIVRKVEVTGGDEFTFKGVSGTYAEMGGDDFAAFAEYVLCVEEDEVDSPIKFTQEMLRQLALHLETDGIPEI